MKVCKTFLKLTDLQPFMTGTSKCCFSIVCNCYTQRYGKTVNIMDTTMDTLVYSQNEDSENKYLLQRHFQQCIVPDSL